MWFALLVRFCTYSSYINEMTHIDNLFYFRHIEGVFFYSGTSSGVHLH